MKIMGLVQEITIHTNLALLNKPKSVNSFQFFGSMEERFKSQKTNKKVGPGSYDFINNPKKKQESKYEKIEVPFDTSDKRFRYTSKQKLGPGPDKFTDE